jgi:membrane-associated protein
MTKDFYERWGVFAIVASRWVPIVRTFAPILAGVTRMPYRTFVPFNVLGGFSWVLSMVLLGYFLPPLAAHFFPQFNFTAHIEKIVMLIIFLSFIPIAYTIWKERRQGKMTVAARLKRPAKKK